MHGLFSSTAGDSNLAAMFLNHISTPILHTARRNAHFSFTDFVLNLIKGKQDKKPGLHILSTIFNRVTLMLHSLTKWCIIDVILLKALNIACEVLILTGKFLV